MSLRQRFPHIGTPCTIEKRSESDGGLAGCVASEDGRDESSAVKAPPSVARSTLVMSAATMLSKLTGFFRTWAMAFALGNTVLASSYQIAFNVPSMLYELVAGGILTTAFLPVFLSVKSSLGEKGAWAFFSNLCSLVVVTLGAVAVLATVFAPQVVATQTFMTGGAAAEQAVFFFRFFAVQVLFLGLGALFGGVLNAHRQYFWPAASSAFNNVVVIITFFGYVPLSDWNAELAKVWLAAGTTLGGLMMCACLVPALRKTGARFRFKIDFSDPALKEVARIAVPVIVFTVANLVAVSFRNAFALEAASNGPSTIQYAWMWYQLPYGIVAAALSMALFTELADLDAIGDKAAFKAMFAKGFKTTLFLIVPLAACLMVLADPLASLYHAGEFTQEDVAEVARVLFWWGTTLPLYSLYMYLYRVFSALKDLMRLTQVDVALRALNIACYVVFTGGFGSFEGFGLVGIPLADTVFYLLMNVALLFLLRKRIGSFGGRTLAAHAVKVSAAAIVTVIAGRALMTSFFGSFSGIPQALLAVCAGGALMVTAYAVACVIFKLPEAQLVLKALGRKVGKA